MKIYTKNGKILSKSNTILVDVIPAPIVTATFRGVAVSDDGKYYYAGNASNNKIYRSEDGSNKWYSIPALDGLSGDIPGYAISSTGQYVVIWGIGNNYAYSSNDYGLTWTQLPNSYNWYEWQDGQMSDDGQYQTLISSNGYTFGTSDYGTTWVRGHTQLNNSYALSVSSTGEFQWTGNSSYMYKSVDYGINFTILPTPTTSTWIGLAVSDNGQYVFAVSRSRYEGIHVSNDSGSTFTFKSTSGYWRDIAMSTSGQYGVATRNTSGIWTTNDYGENWTEHSTVTLGDRNICKISKSGQYMVTSFQDPTDGGVYMSNDYGVTWNNINRPGDWGNISMSSSGQYIAIAAYNMASGILATRDYGQSWGLINRLVD